MTPLLPDHCLYIAAEAEIDLEDVDSCLPEDDALTSETGHQVLRDNAHANVRLRAEVWQNILKQDSVRYIFLARDTKWRNKQILDFGSISLQDYHAMFSSYLSNSKMQSREISSERNRTNRD